MGAEKRTSRALPWQVLTGVLVVATGVLLTGQVDLDPPRIAVEPAELPARSGPDLSLRVEARDSRPGLGRLEARLDDGPWTELEPEADGSVTWSPSLGHGAHTLALRATDASWLANQSAWSGTVEVDAAGPDARLVLPGGGLEAGAARWVAVESDADAATARLVLDGREWPLLSDGPGRFRGLVALPVEQEDAELVWSLQLTDDLGNAAEQSGTVSGHGRAWPRGGTIALTAAQQAARDDSAALQAMHRDRAEATGQTRAAPVLDAVQRPTRGWISSPFGRYRSYSDGARQHHLGLDIANVLGAPVLAMAPGRVTLATEQPIHGLTVIVDHGWGVCSSYSHLSAIEVEVGAELAAGQQLGRVGSTGQSTGPHLHWEITVGGVAVDPAAWLEAPPQPDAS